MKKIFSLLIAIAFFFGIVSCSRQQGEAEQAQAQSEADDASLDSALDSLRAEAERLRAEAIQNGYDQSMPDEWSTAEEAYDRGNLAYGTDDAEAQSGFSQAIELYLAMGVQPVAEPVAASGTFPASYLIGSWDSARDCFWNIAANPAVYGNPNEWQRLYEANKDVLPNPEDPNLILPGTLIQIPSIKGETREGTYDVAVQYGDINNL